ncbi:MAG: metallophosphoesterase [Acidobacteriota bacterium]|nr:metallophosphoesterase [Acidobacteriota bacterium]
MRRFRALPTHPNELIRITFMLAIWIGLHLYASRPLLVAAAAGGIAPLVAWSVVLLIPCVTVLPMLSRRRIPQAIGYGVMSIFSMLLVLVLTSDFLRIALRIFRATISARAISFTTLGLAGVLALIGFLQARRPRVVSLQIPSDLDGYRIVQWSDVHIGPTIQRSFVESLVRRTNALNADAIVITGDLIDGHVEDLRDAIEPLRDLRARDGVFVVTGNHEYYWRASEWVKEFARLGMTFLKNEHRVVRDGLVIAGVTDPAGRDTHKSNLTAALDGAPSDAFRVLLAHRPQVAEAASRHGVDLQLSGHTHGGQFFPFNLLIRWFQPVVAGLHRVGETLLYVSRGTGYWGPPSRLGVGGEITLITLGQK